MRGSVSRILGHFAALIPPALVLLLLGVQVAFGLRGFDRPDDSLIQVLQVPGILLGWGGVALLVPLLTWMIMDWWGYDLTGFALKGLGSGVLGVAIAGLVAINGGAAEGGIVGAGLADVLVKSLGTTFAVVLLFVMVGPAGVLALSMQRGAVAPAPRADEPAEATTPEASPDSPRAKEKTKRSWRVRLPRINILRRKSRGGLPPVEKRAWYPERRYDDDGNELPPDFGNPRGIGGIRFADEDEPIVETEQPETLEPPVAEAAQPPPADLLEDEERLPTIPELLSGQYDPSQLDLDPHGLDEDPSGGAIDERTSAPPMEDDGPIHVDSEGRPIAAEPLLPPQPPPVIPDPEPEPEPEPIWSSPAEPEPEPEEPALPFVQLAAAAEGVEPPLMPGVRYADEVDEQVEPHEEPEAEFVGTPTNGHATAVEDPMLSPAIEQAVRGPTRVEIEDAPRGRIESLKQTLVESFQQTGNSDRYLAKLEAIGMFDPVESLPSADAPAAPAPAAATRRPATAKKKAKRKAAKKKAVRKTAKKKTAKKKAATRKKVAKKKAARKKPRR